MKRKFFIFPAVAAVFIGLFLTFFTSPDIQAKNQLQQDISNKIVRFHVRANSDSDNDQALKLSVKDAVVSYLSDVMKNSSSKADSLTYIENNISQIEKIASEVISEAGCNYDVNAYITREFFPTKSYGDITIPCGTYDAFRIDIGNSCGHNWWCVLYPPLCFVEGSYGIATDESKTLLLNVLDEDEFSYITNASSDKISFDFKILSLFR